MKIPARLVEFIQGPTIQHVGVRDAALQPDWALCLGARASSAEHITLYVLDPYAGPILTCLTNNGQVALCVASATNECYQFKGEFTSAQPSDDHDYAIQDIFWDKLMNSPMFDQGPQGEMIARAATMIRRPTAAITFKVVDIFDQTPGPGSGKAINE